MPHRNCLAYRLVDLFSLRVLAKKLFAHEEQSYTEAVALDVLVMPLAGANLLAILNGIAAQRHSGTVAVAVVLLVPSQSLLNDADDVRLREELVGPAGHVPLRELDGPVQGLLACQIPLRHSSSVLDFRV